MEYLHIDVWSNQDPANFILQVTPINASTGAGETLLTINHTKHAWYSVDIPKSAFTGMTWDLVKEMKFAANGNICRSKYKCRRRPCGFRKIPPVSTGCFDFRDLCADNRDEAAFRA